MHRGEIAVDLTIFLLPRLVWVCLCGRLTFAAVPTPEQFTTPPKGARVSFVQLAVASTAASISARIVMSALKNLT
jgi:hypothetical protein